MTLKFIIIIKKKTNDQLLAELIQETLVEKTNAADRKARVYNELLVIREAHMPACLIESAYLSNEDERESHSNKTISS